MPTLLSEQAERHQIELEARGTSGSSITKTTALALLLLMSRPGAGLAATLEQRFPGLQTTGTGAEVLSLRITEADLFSEINRVYDELLKGQVDFDLDSRRALYGQLWDLYS